MVGAPLGDVFSIVSREQAFKVLAAYASPFCFKFLWAAMLAAMLMGSFCILRSRRVRCGERLETGFERVGTIELPLFLDPGFGALFFEHVAHVWKGKLAMDESEETVSILSSGIKEFQVTSCGILAGFLALGEREFWKERQEIHNDVRSAVVDEVEFQAAASSGTSSSQPENLEVAMVQSG